MKLSNAFSNAEIYSVTNFVYKLSVRLMSGLISLGNCVLFTVRCFKNRMWYRAQGTANMYTIL